MSTEKVKNVLMAQDMGRALDFHTQVFGFIRGFESDHWSELMHGDAVIAFHGGGDGSKNVTGLSIQVSDALATAKVIQATGGQIVELPYQREGEPIMLGFFQDTEGNEIMLTQYMG